MLKIEIIKRKYTNEKLEKIVYQVTDNKNYITFLVVEFDKDKANNFKNELICNAIETNQFPTWQELDNLISEVRRSGVVFL
jgi:hypothetical protein